MRAVAAAAAAAVAAIASHEYEQSARRYWVSTRMQERNRLRSRAGGRMELVLSERAGPAEPDASFSKEEREPGLGTLFCSGELEGGRGDGRLEWGGYAAGLDRAGSARTLGRR
jgi:hypothetical protein